MRTHFKTGYHQDIRLFADGRVAFRYAVLVALAAALPFALDDFLLGEVTNVLIWAIAGMGLMVLTGHAGQPSLGHAAFLAVGCYVHAILMDRFGLPFLASFTLAGLATGLVGVLVAIPALRLHGIYLAIATLALSILTEDIIVLAEPWTGGVVGLNAPPITIAGVEVDRFASPDRFYWLCLAVALLVTLGYRNLLRGSLGRAFTAIRDSEVSAQAMGVSPARTKAAAFGLSCMATGWAGRADGALRLHVQPRSVHRLHLDPAPADDRDRRTRGDSGRLVRCHRGRTRPAGDHHCAGLGVRGARRCRRRRPQGSRRGLFALILILILLFEPHGIHGRLLKWKLWFELFPLARRDMFRRQRRYLKTERLR